MRAIRAVLVGGIFGAVVYEVAVSFGAGYHMAAGIGGALGGILGAMTGGW